MNVGGGDTLLVDKITKEYVVLKKAPAAKDLIGIVKKQKSDPIKRTRNLRESWR